MAGLLILYAEWDREAQFKGYLKKELFPALRRVLCLTKFVLTQPLRFPVSAVKGTVDSGVGPPEGSQVFLQGHLQCLQTLYRNKSHRHTGPDPCRSLLMVTLDSFYPSSHIFLSMAYIMHWPILSNIQLIIKPTKLFPSRDHWNGPLKPQPEQGPLKQVSPTSNSLHILVPALNITFSFCSSKSKANAPERKWDCMLSSLQYTPFFKFLFAISLWLLLIPAVFLRSECGIAGSHRFVLFFQMRIWW